MATSDFDSGYDFGERVGEAQMRERLEKWLADGAGGGGEYVRHPLENLNKWLKADAERKHEPPPAEGEIQRVLVNYAAALIRNKHLEGEVARLDEKAQVGNVILAGLLKLQALDLGSLTPRLMTVSRLITKLILKAQAAGFVVPPEPAAIPTNQSATGANQK